MAYSYFHNELARDIAIGRPEEEILKKYTRFHLSKNKLKKLLDSPNFQLLLEDINNRLDEETAKARRRLISLSQKALDILESDLTAQPFNEDGTRNPFFHPRLRNATAIKVLEMTNINPSSKKSFGVNVQINLIKEETTPKTIEIKSSNLIPRLLELNKEPEE